MRTKKTTDDGLSTYAVAREAAQRKANEVGLEVGLEWLGTYGGWRSFLLPRPENRQGFELRCEVVRPEVSA